MVPPDQAQGEALARLVARYGWGNQSRLISAISTSDQYGVGGIEAFRQAGASLRPGFTVKDYQQITSQPKNRSDVSRQVGELAASKSRVFLAFMLAPAMQLVLREAIEFKLIGPTYVWLCSDGCAQSSLFTTDNTIDYALRNASRGMIGTNPSGGKGTLYDLFLDDWSRRDPSVYPGAGKRSINLFAPHAYDCVYTFALAFDQMIREGRDLNNATDILVAVRATEFEGLTGLVRFNRTNGDRTDFYDIVNLRDDNATFTTVGSWLRESVNATFDGFSFNVSIQFYSGTDKAPDLDIRPPFNYWDCREGKKGTDKSGKNITLSKPKGNNPHYIAFHYRCDQFIDCDNMSDEDLSCSPSYVATFISFGIITGMLVLTVPLFAASAIAFGFIWKKRRIRLISPVFLVGMCIATMLGYLSTFAWYGQPNEVACNFQPWMLGLAVNLMISFLFAKTFRIWRIFKSPFVRKSISDLQLMVLVVILMIPAVIILAIWTGISTPTTVFEDREGDKHLVCDTGGVTGPPGGTVFFFIFVGYTVSLSCIEPTYFLPLNRAVSYYLACFWRL